MSALNLETDTDILTKMYGGDSKLDKKDKFLREYILGQTWKKEDEDDDNYAEYQEKLVDKEDEERDEEMDQYEAKYNFRYEDKTGAYLTTYAREAPADSMRRTESKRAQQRQDANQRRLEEKQKRKDEINKLKALKREEIITKLKKAEFLAGKLDQNDKKLLDKVEKELNTEFIPDMYDKAMNNIFDEAYYKVEEEEDLEQQQDINMKLMDDQFEEIGRDGGESEDDYVSNEGEGDQEKVLEERQQKKQKKYEEYLAKSVKKQVDDQEAAEGYDTWYACDGCHRAIGPGEYRYDCTVCPDFTFCEKCYKQNTTHLHKFKRIKNQTDLAPPENAEELIGKSYMLCVYCRESLLDLNKRVYICREESPDPEAGDAVYSCKKCKESGKDERKWEKYKGHAQAEEDGGKSGQKQKYLDKLLEEYYELDCEDVIGGGKVKARFKYRTVPKEDYGLTQEEILLLDDKQMNQLVSMKKLRPYRHLDENGQELTGDALRKQTKVNHGKIQKLKSQFKADLDYKRKLVKENQLANLNLEKEQYLGTSGKISKAERKMQKQEKKNKKAKYIKHKKGGDGSEEGDEGEGEEQVEKVAKTEEDADALDEKQRKKRRRLAAYGV